MMTLSFPRFFAGPLRCGVISLLLLCHVAVPAQGGPPRGIFCSCPGTSGFSSSFIAEVAAKPYVDGVLVRVAWNQLETAPGVFDWTLLDAQRDLLLQAGKLMTLAVVQGVGTPAWLQLLGVATVTYNFAGQQLTLPVPWDPIYIARWTTFVNALGARYDGDPTLALVHATHATHNSLEMQLGFGAEPAYLAAGYSDGVYAQSWGTVIGAFLAAFPNHFVDADLHPVFGSDVVAQQVTAQGIAQGGARFGVFGGWWSVPNAEITYPGMFALFQSTAATSFANAQNVGSWTTTPSRYHNDLAEYEAGFALAIESGLRYVEVWNADLLNASLAAYLTGVADELRCTGWYQRYESSLDAPTLTLSLIGCSAPFQSLTLTTLGGVPNAAAARIYGTERGQFSILSGVLLVGDPANLVVEPFQLDGSGSASLSLVLPGSLPQATLMIQSVAYDGSTNGFLWSNALEVRTP